VAAVEGVVLAGGLEGEAAQVAEVVGARVPEELAPEGEPEARPERALPENG
jgi:hypothetical protein